MRKEFEKMKKTILLVMTILHFAALQAAEAAAEPKPCRRQKQKLKAELQRPLPRRPAPAARMQKH